MRDSAQEVWKDRFFTNDINWCLNLYSQDLNGISNKLKERLQNSFFNYPSLIDVSQFSQKSEPRSKGGFEYLGQPENYVYDCPSLKAWHSDWNRNHTDLVEWEDEIFPFKSVVIEIMREELRKITLDSSNFNSEERNLLLQFQQNRLNSHDIAIVFHELVVKHKVSEELIAYACEIGGKICEENGFHRENELEKLEKRKRDSIVRIYSIKDKNGKYIFLSIDKRHGMFEWCGDDGTHKGERKFDGSYNSDAEPKDHSLNCVAEWKRLQR